MRIFNFIIGAIFVTCVWGCNEHNTYAPNIVPIKSEVTINENSPDKLSKVISFVVVPAPKNATERRQAVNDFIAAATREFYHSIGKHKEIFLFYDLYEETEDLTENFEAKSSWHSIAISPDSGEAKEGLEVYGKGHHLAKIDAFMSDNCKIALYARVYTYFLLIGEKEEIIVNKNEQLNNCQAPADY